MGVSVQAASPGALREALGPLVGGRARVAGAGDGVAGVRPAVVAEPGDEGEVAAVLAFADREGLKVLPRGGGTQLGLGHPPAGGDILLDLGRLDAVVEYAPGDLTVTARAGLRLVDLQAALAGEGQWLALDPALPPAATIGGIVATNASGPRRLRYGGVRDQIIGVRVARADGTIARGGGKVVKNVAGFDLPKLFTGALGTLGVIIDATFRLYPIPAASRTVLLGGPDPDALCDLALKIINSTLIASAIDLYGATTTGEGPRLAVRFEGDEEAVEDQARGAVALAGPLGEGAQTLSQDEERIAWHDGAADPVGTPASAMADGPGLYALLKASVLPGEVGRWLDRLGSMAATPRLEATWRAHAGHGLIVARLRGVDDALIAAVGELREVALAGRGSLVVTDAPPALAARLDPWGPSPALDLIRRVKAQFDPHGTLNPGRFIGGL